PVSARAPPPPGAARESGAWLARRGAPPMGASAEEQLEGQGKLRHLSGASYLELAKESVWKPTVELFVGNVDGSTSSSWRPLPFAYLFFSHSLSFSVSFCFSFSLSSLLLLLLLLRLLLLLSPLLLASSAAASGIVRGPSDHSEGDTA
ncbi:unnamed protein product, partial [Prorocentrum cordatum]